MRVCVHIAFPCVMYLRKDNKKLITPVGGWRVKIEGNKDFAFTISTFVPVEL